LQRPRPSAGCCEGSRWPCAGGFSLSQLIAPCGSRRCRFSARRYGSRRGFVHVAASHSGLHRGTVRPNNSFKPNLLRYTKAMADKACHGFGSTTQVGLTQALGGRPDMTRRWLQVAALAPALVGALYFEVEWGAPTACLDLGGSFDYAEWQCSYINNHPYVDVPVYQLTSFWLFVASMVVSVGAFLWLRTRRTAA